MTPNAGRSNVGKLVLTALLTIGVTVPVTLIVLQRALGWGPRPQPRARAVATAEATEDAATETTQATPVSDEPPADPYAWVEAAAAQLREKDTLAEAIEFVRPYMSDEYNRTSVGADLLALWATGHMAWSDVAVKQNETSFALVQKDADAQRGKRLCVSGGMVQIGKVNDEWFRGLLITGSSNLYNFLSVGDTGDLVEGSRARFCGVVIGSYSYDNSGGGTGHAVQVVGLFDLPANRQRIRQSPQL